MLPASGRQHRGCIIRQTVTQSSAPEDGQNNFLKHVELTGIINKPLLLHLVGCLYYLYQRRTVKQISDNEIYLLIKYIKSVPWRGAKRLSYIEDARCLKVKRRINIIPFPEIVQYVYTVLIPLSYSTRDRSLDKYYVQISPEERSAVDKVFFYCY